MKKFFIDLIGKIENSFLKANRGEEEMKIIIRYWGFISYVFFYFVIEKTIKKVDIIFIDYLLSILAVLYFSWHIFVIKRCQPKDPTISKFEARKRRIEALKNIPRAFFRKLFLQEPIAKFNPITMIIVADLLFLLNFLSYII